MPYSNSDDVNGETLVRAEMTKLAIQTMKYKSFLKLTVLTLAGLAFTLHAQAQSTQASKAVVAAHAPLTISPELREQTFDMVWRTVNDKHFDTTFGGVNWQQVRVKYAPLVRDAKSDAEFYTLLQQMLGELRQSHFAIVPPDAVFDEDHQAASGESGMEVKLLGVQAFVSYVKPDSAAARAGLRPGFALRQIGDTPVAQLIEKLSKSTETESIKRLRTERLITARLNGEPGSSVKVTYLDERNQPRETSVTRTRVMGEYSPAFGNFPPQLLDFEAKRLPSGHAYIRFNIWVTPMMPKIRAALRDFADAPGLIFDLRGNPGGIGGMASGIGGHLFEKETSLGKMQMRSGYTNFAIFPQTLMYTGPVAILLDGGSASTSEVFASGMQELGRAVIVGQRSTGAALPSLMQKLPTGAVFQYAIGDFKTPKGTLIEGRGVIPDVEIKLTRAGLLSGRDISLEAAVTTLQKQARPAAKGGAKATSKPFAKTPGK